MGGGLDSSGSGGLLGLLFGQGTGGYGSGGNQMLDQLIQALHSYRQQQSGPPMWYGEARTGPMSRGTGPSSYAGSSFNQDTTPVPASSLPQSTPIYSSTADTSVQGYGTKVSPDYYMNQGLSSINSY